MLQANISTADKESWYNLFILDFYCSTFFVFAIKTQICILFSRTTRFWKNKHQVSSYSKYWKAKDFKGLWEQEKPKALNIYPKSVTVTRVLRTIFDIYVLCCDVRYDCRIHMMFGLSLSPVVCRREHVLFTLFVYSGVQHILFGVFVLFFIVLFFMPCVASFSWLSFLDCTFGIL